MDKYFVMNTTYRFRPKKDQCVTCNQYKQKEESGNIDESTTHAYQQHQRRKLQGRQEKENDKRSAKENKTFSAATFDLEVVLSTPCSLVCQAYYQQKVSCYNLSLYSLGDNKGTCILWNETAGERGFCEVAT
jgi:hypothetical protein